MSAFTLLYDSGPLAAPASSITATVDTTYRKFRVTLYAIKDASAAVIQMRINGDSGANYSQQSIIANSTSALAARTTQQAVDITLNQLGASQPFMATVDIEKPLSSLPARINVATSYMNAGPDIVYEARGASWSNVADLVSEIAVFVNGSGNFAAGTRMVVEGAAP